MQPECKTCGCNDFDANNFQPNLCKNCLHNHQTPPPTFRTITYKPNSHLELGVEFSNLSNDNLDQLFQESILNYDPNVAMPHYTNNPHYQSFANTHTIPEAPLPRPPNQQVHFEPSSLPPRPPKPQGPLPPVPTSQSHLHQSSSTPSSSMSEILQMQPMNNNNNNNNHHGDLVLPNRPPPIPTRPRSQVFLPDVNPLENFAPINPMDNFAPISNIQSPPPELIKRPLPPIPTSQSPLPPQITTGRSRRERKKKTSASSREPRNRKKETEKETEKEKEKEKGKEKSGGMSFTSLYFSNFYFLPINITN